MIDKQKLVEVLNREKDYEEKISEDLSYYIDYSLDEIKDITPEQKEQIKNTLSIISKESLMHMNIFIKLIEKYIENGENN